MNLSISNQASRKIIHVDSRTISTGNLRDFRDQVLPQLDQDKQILLDLSKVTFIDSAGLGALISCLRVCAENEAELVLVNLNRNVKTLFELMKVQRLFNIEDSLPVA